MISACENAGTVTACNACGYFANSVEILDIAAVVGNISVKHEKVYLIVGRNKLAPTYEEALWRARNIAAPQNAARKQSGTPCTVDGRCHDCKSPGRICRGLTVQWMPIMGMETEIVLVNEDLGY